MEDGQTLKEVFQKAGLDSDHLTIDAFNVLADYSVYQRFDNFNSKYSPFRLAQMRKIFLKVCIFCFSHLLGKLKGSPILIDFFLAVHCITFSGG